MKPLYALACALLVTGCAAQPQLPTYSHYEGPTLSKTFVTVRWMDDPSKMCEAIVMPGVPYRGCATLDVTKERCIIFVRKPKDFNDTAALTVLGHEMLHCLGAKH